MASICLLSFCFPLFKDAIDTPGCCRACCDSSHGASELSSWRIRLEIHLGDAFVPPDDFPIVIYVRTCGSNVHNTDTTLIVTITTRVSRRLRAQLLWCGSGGHAVLV